MENKVAINIYRCEIDASHPIQVLGGSIFEARRSLRCFACKEQECKGPVLLENVPTPKPEPKPKPEKTATPPTMKEWREGRPPQGKYLLETGDAQYEVDVGYNVYTLNGKTRHISRAFAVGILRGPIQKQKEEQSMRGRKAKEKAMTTVAPVVTEEFVNKIQKMATVAEVVAGEFVDTVLEMAKAEFTPVEAERKPELVKSVTKAPTHPVLDITIEEREALRKDLLALAQTPPQTKRRSIASVLVNLFGAELCATRDAGHGWDTITKVIQNHGLHISRKNLKSSFEEYRAAAGD
jgi:hypothetical protein